MTIDETLKERGNRYGDFTEHARAAQELQNIFRNQAGWANLDVTKRQALTVIADKIARILCGDPEYKDNWHDIQGYAKLAEDRCADPQEIDEDIWDDGWNKWSGGECPVNGYSIVDVKFYNGRIARGYAANFDWRHDAEYRQNNIVGYR